MYIVVREGVYQRGIFGVFDSFDKARLHADNSIKNENDDYHQFSVYEIPLNKELTGETMILFGPYENSGKEVHRVTRNKGELEYLISQ